MSQPYRFCRLAGRMQGSPRWLACDGSSMTETSRVRSTCVSTKSFSKHAWLTFTYIFDARAWKITTGTQRVYGSRGDSYTMSAKSSAMEKKAWDMQ